MLADYGTTGLTVSAHPIALLRERLPAGTVTSRDLEVVQHGTRVKAGGLVVARQRPGTAKGFVFLSLEDETGVSNAIVTPDLFQQNRLLLGTEQFVLIEGILQNQDGVISVKAARVAALKITHAQTVSHDFH